MKEKDTSRGNLVIFVIFICFIVCFVFWLIRYSSLANFNNPFTSDISFSTLKLDESAYGDTIFNAENIDFTTILDKDIDSSFDHIIYIPFWVGGNEENDAEDPIYDIALKDLVVDCELLSPYVKWTLKKNGDEISSGSLDYQFDTITNGRLVLTPIQQDLKPYSDDKSSYDYFEFYLWLSDSCQEEDITLCKNSEIQNNLLHKKISGKIEVELYAKSKKNLIRKPSEEINKSTCIS